MTSVSKTQHVLDELQAYIRLKYLYETSPELPANLKEQVEEALNIAVPTQEGELKSLVRDILSKVYNEEIAGHFPEYMLLYAEEMSGYNADGDLDLWKHNLVQFARLICEIDATQELDFEDLGASMDLKMEDIHELLERAHKVWEDAKRKV